MDFKRKETWFALGSLIAAATLFLFSGGAEWGWWGIGMTLVGMVDFLFVNNPFDRSLGGGRYGSYDYGEAGEELWQFRSFILMVGGPLVILFGLLFLNA